jgi:Gpi18-like mannosyltransferase
MSHDDQPQQATATSSRRLAPLIVAAILLAVLLLLILPFQRSAPVRIPVGTEQAGAVLSGFSFPEAAPDGATYRWSEGQAAIRFDDVANRPLTVRAFLNAMRPDKPPTVTLTLNGTPIASFAAGGAFAEYTAVAPRSAVGWSGAATVGIEVEPFTAPPDTRELGAAVSWVEISPAGGPALPPSPTLLRVILPLLLTVLGVLLLGSRLRLRWTLLTAVSLAIGVVGSLALWRAPSIAAKAAWPLALAVWLIGAAVIWGPGLARRILRLLNGVRQRHPVGFWVVVMIMAAALIYLPLAKTEGYWGDIEIYMAWTHQVTHNGIHSAYNPEAAARPNTTPFLLYPFRVIGGIFQALWSPDFPPTWIDRTNQGYLRYMLRLPGIIFTGLLAFAVYRVVKRQWGQQLALMSSAAYLFNPAVIFETAYMGQTGAVHGLFMFLGVVGLARGMLVAAWAALAAGMLTKPQADIFLPLFIILTVARYGWRGLLKGVAAALVVGLVLLAPFITHGTLGYMWERISRPADYHPILSATAHNIWWLFSLGQGKTSDLLIPPFLQGLGWPIFTYRMIGMGLFGLAYLLVLARVLRDRTEQTLYLSSAFLFTSFFMLATQIHENHLTPMFPLLVIACATNKRYWRIYWLFALCSTLNMALHYPQILRWLVPQNPDVWGGAEMAPWRWLSSLLQVGVYAYWLALFLRETLSAWQTGRARQPKPAAS